MKPNIEPDIQPQVQQIELRGSDWKFSGNLSIRERLINGRIAKGSSYSILPLTNKSVKNSIYSKLCYLEYSSSLGSSKKYFKEIGYSNKKHLS